MLRAINTSASRQGSICCQKLIKTDCTFGGTYFTKHVSLVSKSVLNCPDNSLFHAVDSHWMLAAEEFRKHDIVTSASDAMHVDL